MDRPVMVITGASRGIGAATAVAAAPVFDLVLGYLADHDAADAVARECSERGAGVLTVATDLSDEPGVLGLFRAVDAGPGRIDALVNNAGIVSPRAEVADYTAERLRRILDVNVLGPFLCAREAVRRMSTARGGRGGSIVNVSSAASRLGSAGEYVDYAATKGAVDTMTLGLAREVADQGIRVNAVRPGPIETGIHASGGQPDRLERVRSSIPMGRAGLPEEVAAAILWLTSPAASYTSGALLDVSGGR